MRGPQVTDKADAGTIGANGPTRAANTARTAVVWEALKELLAQLGDREPLEIVDAGGGTGGVAVPLAELGHRVTVVEPSPDSLAALEIGRASCRERASASVVAGAVERKRRQA